MSLFGYVAPHSLDEAIAALESNSGARALAGGHTLLLPANRTKLTGSLLVDLRKIKTLAGVERLPGGALKIGATTTIAELAASDVVRQQIPELCAAALLVGDAQLRNRATIAGNIAASESGSDLPALLLALNARLQIISYNGSREIAIEELFAGAFPFPLASGDLIVSVTVPPPARRSGLAYEKFKHPATLFALCGVAAAVELTSDGTISQARLALTGAAPRLRRLFAMEDALTGKVANEASIHAAAALSQNGGVDFFSDYFASAEYRAHLTQILAQRALKRAIAAATT